MFDKALVLFLYFVNKWILFNLSEFWFVLACRRSLRCRHIRIRLSFFGFEIMCNLILFRIYISLNYLTLSRSHKPFEQVSCLSLICIKILFRLFLEQLSDLNHFKILVESGFVFKSQIWIQQLIRIKCTLCRLVLLECRIQSMEMA